MLVFKAAIDSRSVVPDRPTQSFDPIRQDGLCNRATSDVSAQDVRWYDERYATFGVRGCPILDSESAAPAAVEAAEPKDARSMNALIFKAPNQPLSLESRRAADPDKGEVVVALRAAALNRRDFWITRGLYPGLQPDVVLGSDGAGVIVRVGEGVLDRRLGEEVIIDPSLSWGSREVAQSESYQILGMPNDGTFAQEVVVPEGNAVPKPEHLNWEEAAALPLAGLTAYRALVSRGGCIAGERVLVTGIGGGVATWALQFAVAMGAEAYVTSSSGDKIRRACDLGAKVGFDYRANDWGKAMVATHGPPDLIVDGAGGEGYAELVRMAAFGGRLVSYGATAGAPPSLDLFKVFWKQLSLLGSTMGSPADFRAMLDFVRTHRLRPAVDEVFSLASGNTAIERLGQATHFGKIVLRVDGSV